MILAIGMVAVFFALIVWAEMYSRRHHRRPKGDDEKNDVPDSTSRQPKRRTRGD